MNRGADRAQKITSRSAFELADAIRRRELSSVAVVSAHVDLLKRTAPRLNAIVADRYDEAIERAREIDAEIAKSALRGRGRAVEPLLGVPFTVKESVAVSGMPHTAGVVARKTRIAKRTATVVRRLQEAGAIPLGVTNTSELTLWIESENRLYGRTNNPYDPARTAGGSSGGEGAAIAVGGSPFGVAADIGGSIRIPALFCGVFGHKPSAGLVPNTGVWPGASGDVALMLATGMLARRVEDLMPLLSLIAGPDGHDPTTTSLELGDPGAVSLHGLQVTTIDEPGPRPMYSRPLMEARDRALAALVEAGAQPRRIKLPNRYETVLPFLAALTGDVQVGPRDAGGSGIAGLRARGRRMRARRLSGPVSALLAQSGGPPVGLRELMLGSRTHTIPTRLTLGFEWLGGAAAEGSRSRQLARASSLAQTLVDAIGNGILLHPAFPMLAPQHRRTYGRPWLVMPSAMFNLAGVPVTEVPLGLDQASGLPTGVQVVAPYGEDHLAIAAATRLAAEFGGWRPPPGL